MQHWGRDTPLRPAVKQQILRWGYLSVPSRFVPIRWVFTGLHHCCLIGAPCVSRRGGGGGYVGYIQKALEKGYLAHPRSACCIDCMFEIFVRFGRCMCCLLPLFFNRQLPCLHTNSHHVLVLPLGQAQKPLARKRARSEGANWVRVTRHPEKQAKKPRTAGSQQPACTHREHQNLCTAEASFANQFWDSKVHPTKASQHEFLATCIDVDLEKNVKHAQWHKYTRKRRRQTTYFVPHRGGR